MARRESAQHGAFKNFRGVTIEFLGVDGGRVEQRNGRYGNREAPR
jgi:hypothetical protein